MNNSILTIKSVKKKYGKKQVLNDISISAPAGSCIGIVGVNGSGKSTFFNVLAGIISGDAGTFEFEGVDMFSNKSFRRKKLGYITQYPPLFDELTSYDNLRLWYSRASLKKEFESGVLKMLGVDEFLNVKVSNLSGGMKKRLAIGCAVSHGPRLLLLDEPTAALDLVCKEKIRLYLEDFKKSGGIVLIATHDVRELDMCDKVYLFKNGTSSEYIFDNDTEKLIGSL